MPLNTKWIRKDGSKAELPHGWDEVVLNLFLNVACVEAIPDQEATASGLTFKECYEAGKYVNLADTGVYYLDVDVPLWKQGEQIVREHYEYDLGEYGKLEFHEGDLLKMWRD